METEIAARGEMIQTGNQKSRDSMVCQPQAPAEGSPRNLENDDHADELISPDLAKSIGNRQVQAMTATLARILVARALAEHGIDTGD